MPTFETFKAGPGGAFAREAGAAIDGCTTWREYQATCTHTKNFAKSLVERAKSASTGEKTVIAALLHDADYATQADAILPNGFWQALSRTEGSYKAAVLACIARVEG